MTNLRQTIAFFAVLFLFLMVISKQGRYFLQSRKYLLMYVVLNILIVFIHAVYCIIKYDENFIDVYVCATRFLLMLLTPLYAYAFRNDEHRMQKMVRLICIIGVLASFIGLMHGICSSFGIPYILPESYKFGGFRYGRLRIALMNISRFSNIYFAYVFLVEKRNRLFYGILSATLIFTMVYYGSTRMEILSFSACVAVMLFFAGKKSVRYRVLLVIALIAILYFDIASTVLESFSSKSENGASTIARLGAINYFYSIFKANPLFGVGFVRPRNATLRSIWSGPYGTYYFGDLGVLGELFHFGLLGMVLYFVPLIRMIYISVRLLKEKRVDGIWAIGAMTYIVVSQISLNYMEETLVLICPIYWALLETLYKNKEWSLRKGTKKKVQLSDVTENTMHG